MLSETITRQGVNEYFYQNIIDSHEKEKALIFCSHIFSSYSMRESRISINGIVCQAFNVVFWLMVCCRQPCSGGSGRGLIFLHLVMGLFVEKIGSSDTTCSSKMLNAILSNNF